MAEQNNKTSQKARRQQGASPIDTSYGHIQPQAQDVEQVVLGALMIDQEAFTVVSDQLRPETFYDPRHQQIYSAIQTLGMADQPIDITTVVNQLKKDGNLENVGGAPYVVELSGLVVSSAHIAYHCGILVQKYMARQLISFASGVETKAFDETVDVSELMQETEAKLFELSQKNMKKDYEQLGPVLVKTMAQLKENAGKSGMTGIPSLFTKLDKSTSGWQASDLIILAARPAMGKTSFALSIAHNIAVTQKIPVAFFSLEMSDVQIAQRLIQLHCEIEGHKILNSQLDPDEWARLDKSLPDLQNSPLYIDDTAGLSVFELRTKARRLVREHGIKMIMVDYLQLMNANGMRFSSRQEEVSMISRSLKGLAKELNVPVLALSQLSRDVEKRDSSNGIDGKRPVLSDLRESGSIEQDADMVLFIHRPEYYHLQGPNGEDMHGKAIIIIAKHRKGSVGDVYLKFEGKYTKFDNYKDDGSSSGGGEIMGSRMNSDENMGPLPDDPFGAGMPMPEEPMPF